MSELSQSPEKIPVTEEEVIKALDEKGKEDPETNAFFLKYVDQCQAESDRTAAADPENQEAAARANFECCIKLDTLYSKTKRYRREARESLEQNRLLASQNDSYKDLIVRIDALIDQLERP